MGDTVYTSARDDKERKSSVNISNVHSRISQIFWWCVYTPKKSEPISWLIKGKRCIFTDQKQMKFPLTLFLGPRVRWRCGHNAEDLKTRDREDMESWQRISKPRLFRSLPEYEINFPCERIDFSTCGSMPQCLPVNGIVSSSLSWISEMEDR